MDSTWIPTLFETCPGGMSSAVAPELLPPGQFAWGFNTAVRGAKPHTRPPFIERVCGLPPGLHQGSSYFGVQGGMIVVAIAGHLYRVRIGVNTYSSEPIPLPWYNSGTLKQAWFQQTIETLVIQDGQSNAILYDGSTARRAAANEVPRGRSMAYGNGRLWVAINENELVAGDIRTRTPGSELFFTENQYLVGGGALFFPRGITGMDFIPVTGAADFGTLIIGGKDYLESIRADVTTRDQWGMPGFITNVFRDVGFAGDWSIVQVNQDLYWRDADGGIRSLANNISTNSMPGSTPISREVSRLVDYDSDQLLPFCSAIYFDNRLLMTASPYFNISGGVGFKDLVSLDFAPISTMQGKAPPAYDGQWTGIPGIAQLVTGEFDGKERAFAIASDEEGVNRVWEIMKQGRGDITISCGSGVINSPIQSFVEYPAAAFGLRTQRKRLERCDVWVSGVIGELELVAYWRSDNSQKWTEWDRVDTCAKNEDASTATPHVWKNLLPQQRTQIKTFTIPDGIDPVTLYALQVGFEFQIRLAWVGKCQVEKILVYAAPIDDPDYANRETLLTECIENNVSGNRIGYEIPVASGYLGVSGDSIASGTWQPEGEVGGPFTPSSTTFTLDNFSEVPIEWAVTVSEEWMTPDVTSGTLLPGQTIDVVVSLSADGLPESTYTGTISFTNLTNGCVNPPQPVEVTLQVNPVEGFEVCLTADGPSCSWSVTSTPPGVDPDDVIITDGSSCTACFTVPEIGEYVFTTNGDDTTVIFFEDGTKVCLPAVHDFDCGACNISASASPHPPSAGTWTAIADVGGYHIEIDAAYTSDVTGDHFQLFAPNDVDVVVQRQNFSPDLGPNPLVGVGPLASVGYGPLLCTWRIYSTNGGIVPVYIKHSGMISFHPYCT